MILRYYPSKDSTIYENSPTANTGVDSILDISKQAATGSAGGAATSSYNSRILIDFDYNAISASIVSLGYDPNTFTYGLKLYATEADEIPLNYDIDVYGVSGSWYMGLGRNGDSPITTEGVSWYYQQGKTTPSIFWPTSSYPTNVTGSYQVNPGGGAWYTSSAASQSFTYTTTDLDIDVTSIIHEVQSGSIGFNGFIIKKSDSDEQSLTSIKALRFYSKDTGTIYAPVLEAKYDDHTYTGSLSEIDLEDEVNITSINLKESYKEGARPKVNFNANYRYPPQTFATSSALLDAYRLPTGSQYAIYFADSDDALMGFSDYTTLSHNDKGNYLKLDLESFQPERHYRIMLKVPQSDGVSYNIYDNAWIFKVERQ